MLDEVIIVGAGGAGVSALWVAGRINEHAQPNGRVRIVGFADDDPSLRGIQLDGVPVLGSVDEVIAMARGRAWRYHCAMGNNRMRQEFAARFETAGMTAISIIDPSAIVAPNASIGVGCYVGPRTMVGPGARIGRHVLVNTQVYVGSNAVVADFAQLCPGSRVMANAAVGLGAFIASNGVVHAGVAVGPGATLGGVSSAESNLPEGGMALGSPAQVRLRR